MDKPAAVIVIPCYNERNRLVMEEFVCFGRKHPDIHFIFVDDGSSDGTGDLIRPHCGRQYRLLTLARNSGKGEAVRQGVLAALEQGALRIGFWDADLATPLDTICFFVEEMNQNRNLDMIIGSRILRFGAHIKRNFCRHIIGRIFMTLMHCFFDFTVYDSQCGAKMMTAEAAREVTKGPFVTRWLFDLEMIARLQRFRRTDLSASLYEYPLPEWHEVGSSKVRIGTVFHDLLRLFYYYKIRRSQ